MSKRIPILLYFSVAFFTGAVPPESPELGATLLIRTDFWLYEIQGKSEYGKDVHYVISSVMRNGIGYSKNKYIGTIPAGTQLEVVSILKKRGKWNYIVTLSKQSTLVLKPSHIAIASSAMIADYSRSLRRPERVRLDPALFSDFHLPDNSINVSAP